MFPCHFSQFKENRVFYVPFPCDHSSIACSWVVYPSEQWGRDSPHSTLNIILFLLSQFPSQDTTQVSPHLTRGDFSLLCASDDQVLQHARVLQVAMWHELCRYQEKLNNTESFQLEQLKTNQTGLYGQENTRLFSCWEGTFHLHKLRTTKFHRMLINRLQLCGLKYIATKGKVLIQQVAR